MPTIKQSDRKTSGARKAIAGQPTKHAVMSGDGQTRLTEDERRRMVAEAAYYRALQRGFGAGGEVDDWLAAEREIDEKLAAAGSSAAPRAAPVRAKRKPAAAGAPARSVQ